jgi:quinol monooxygenase YgiN
MLLAKPVTDRREAMADIATAASVTYIETTAAHAHDAGLILADYAGLRADIPGMSSVDLLVRDAVPGQFVLVETGPLAAVGDAGDAAEARDLALAPLLVAPCDVRNHGALSVAASDTAATRVAGTLWVVTHVDVVPVHKDSGIARVRNYAAATRRAPGCRRCELWQQADRGNHMTLLEVWADAAARDAHRMDAETRGYRDDLAAASGALYDERLYRRHSP